jgi:hypothetical protein
MTLRSPRSGGAISPARDADATIGKCPHSAAGRSPVGLSEDLFTKRFLSGVRDWLTRPVVTAISTETRLQQSQHDFLMRMVWMESISAAKNPLNRFGSKYFSQADEDGITLEIVRRLGIKAGTFAELGVGNGLENNTLILLASGWRGFWIGGEDLNFNHKLNPKRFAFFKAWVSLENVARLVRQGLENIGTNELDVLSLDLDGNDYYFARELLKIGTLPKLFIVEYNAKFPPPIKWTIEYDANHSWDNSDYYGASLALFSELMNKFSYTLVCCNAATGVNAFFVRNEYITRFVDVPKNIEDIFVGCRYQLYQRWGHPASPKTVERMLQAY